jgi:hypothetical protein
MLLQFGLQQLDKYMGVSSPEVPDMSGPDALGSELRAHFRLRPSLKASLVMVGLQRGDEWNICVPVKYGESLRLRVQRGIYQATAWFFAAAPLMLIATAEAEIVIASGRAEKFTLTGQEPARAYLAQIRNAAPMGPPFMLPDDVTRMLPAAGRNREIPGPPVLEEAPRLEMECSPCCRHVDESGERCSGWPAEGETYCARHSGHSPGQTVSGMEIVSWVASRPPDASQSSSDPLST